MKLLKAAALGLFTALTLGGPAGARSGPEAELPYEGKDTLETTIGRLDALCVLRTWRLKGALACSHGVEIKVCLWVENAYPCGLFEVLRQPFRTQLAEMKAALGALGSGAGAGTGTSSHVPVPGDGTAGQFGEARVYTFVPDLGLSQSDVPIAIPSSARFQPDYVSEIDRLGWRSPLVDEWTCPEAELASMKSCEGIPDPVTCAGTWGTYVPRIGFVNHPSLALGSALAALRAGRVAVRPLGRVVLASYDYEPRTGHYLQMIEPLPKLACSIGSPLPGFMDAGAGSRWGNYLFAHFGIFEYCAGCLPVRLVEARPPAD